MKKKADEVKDEDIHEYAEALIPVRELSLKGSHNLENMLFFNKFGKNIECGK